LTSSANLSLLIYLLLLAKNKHPTTSTADRFAMVKKLLDSALEGPVIPQRCLTKRNLQRVLFESKANTVHAEKPLLNHINVVSVL